MPSGMGPPSHKELRASRLKELARRLAIVREASSGWGTTLLSGGSSIRDPEEVLGKPVRF